MTKFRVILLVLLTIGLCGCGGGEAFRPVSAAFTGTMTSSEGAIGQFSLTYTGGLVGGTGTIVSGGNIVPVSISAVLNGRSFDGEMRNQNLGGGDFAGTFGSETSATGTFSFVDSAETVFITGTWSATAPRN